MTDEEREALGVDLLIAAINEDVDEMKRLIEMGASTEAKITEAMIDDPEICDKPGVIWCSVEDTALLNAADGAHIETVEVLIAAGADVDYINNWRYNWESDGPDWSWRYCRSPLM